MLLFQYSFAILIIPCLIHVYIYMIVKIFVRLKCITCNQLWTGDFMADMGKECAAFVCKKFPDNGNLKLSALGTKRHGISLSETSSMEERKYAADEVQVRSGMCACRGETAGFYHRSCLVKYAQEETKRGISNGEVNLNNAW